MFIWSDSRGQLFIVIHVHDSIIGGEHIVDINNNKKFLFCRFEMKDMEELHYFLGIEVIQTPKGKFMISQRDYILKLLDTFGMTKCKCVANPLDRNMKLDADFETKECEPTCYRQLVGSLIYLTITRPNLRYPSNLLSQCMNSPPLCNITNVS